jgi:hypothetical protein
MTLAWEGIYRVIDLGCTMGLTLIYMRMRIRSMSTILLVSSRGFPYKMQSSPVLVIWHYSWPSMAEDSNALSGRPSQLLRAWEL